MSNETPTSSPMASFKLGTTVLNFGGGSKVFEATDPNALGSTDQSLVTILVDCSSSVEPFASDLEKFIDETLQACTRDPRVDSQMIQVITFSSSGINQVHGFKPLGDCNPGDYTKVIDPYGMTPLNDALMLALETTDTYARDLAAKSFMVNSLIFLITDGDENASKSTMDDVKKKITEMRGVTQEALESLMILMVGVNMTNAYMSARLNDYNRDLGCDGFINVTDASPQSLAKLAQWASSQISSTSAALNSGGPSQVLKF